ncbi:glycosyl transferase family 51 [Xylanimonas cellulosilytica DSM 15894]|uniref:Glycosyl transferase family 51 n=1 Tax=Xylanimonas cellulosilytica (strain DSM 15894 / JCM 12276 / CECT 5975 / KCTC 9989 / LMG 20990 / NBRC 107835 / XIL07) TaxID=446471 RepID=D1BRU0_XYLCX|nr:transglycosylase domain-containing protein [Xylanimonas cellulosilytica]ACZ32356.1 glycosyl transferase family 51 [Xylanimonas cellulosilytica DSM 15894]
MAATGSARRPAKGARRFFNYPRRGKGPIHRWIPSWRVVVGAFLGFFALGAGVAVAAYASTAIPEGLDSINNQVTTIYYSDGVTELTTIQNETRIKVGLANLPPYVADAVIASEDSTFRTNSGVDPRGLARALWTNLTTGARQGGSTLTQQYVERTLTDSETSYLGKVREMIIAVKVTRSVPKDEILQSYLNTIYWGRNVNGIGAAAQAYFAKPAEELTLSEAALLAGIIPSPNRWDPGVNVDQAERRWNRVLNRMLDQGLISAAERAEAVFPEHFMPRPEPSNSLGGQTGYIVRMIENEIGDMEPFRDDRLRTRGLKIVTTIDKPLQDQAAAIAATAYEGDNPADPRLRIGLVSMDPATGELRAVYGGTDYIAKEAPGGQFNFAMQGGAQGGSTFKPFTLLGALEDGHQLNERFDGQSQMPLPGWGDGKGPRNFNGINYYNLDLVEATAESVNSVYAQLNMAIGPQRLVDVAHELGIPDPVKDPANPTQKEKLTPGWIDANNANVLGTATVRPVDLATAYATLANGGSRVTPHVVRQVTDLEESLIYTGPTNPTRTSFDPNNIAAVTYALTHVVTDGSGRTAQELNRPVAGKTGTSNDNKSAWFAGYVPQMVTVVGLMQEDESGNVVDISPFGQWAGKTITGSTFPVRAWTDFMKVALDGAPVMEFPAYTPPRPLPSPTPSEEETPTDEPTEEAEPVDPQAGWAEVPRNLTGRDIAKVTQTLEKLGLKVRPSPVDSDQRKGTVLAVSGEGSTVPPGSTITVDVSTGRSASGGEDPTPDPTPEDTSTPEPSETATQEPSPDPTQSPPADAADPALPGLPVVPGTDD